jgi:hypothetical protein
VDGEDVGVGVLVGDEDELAIGVEGGGDDAVLAVEGAEGELPEGLAVEGVGEEAEVGEEDVDVLAVGGGGGGGAMVEGVLGFAFGGAEGAAQSSRPEDCSRQMVRRSSPWAAVRRMRPLTMMGEDLPGERRFSRGRFGWG